MAKVRFNDKRGVQYFADFFCTIEKEFANKSREGKTWVEIADSASYPYGYSEVKHLSVYWRSARTWDDHMGNTPCGYYVIVPLPTGERKRVYYD